MQLPPFSRKRDNLSLHLHLALRFPDAATADSFENNLPAFRAGLLQTVDALDKAAFRNANAVSLQEKLTAGILAYLPTLKPENILIVDCYTEKSLGHL